jgi:hypothetical protein
MLGPLSTESQDLELSVDLVTALGERPTNITEVFSEVPALVALLDQAEHPLEDP